MNNKLQIFSLKQIYEKIFSNYGKFDLEFLSEISNKDIINTADRIVHYGWKKEAIPVTQNKKSLIARLFDTVFG